MGCLFLKQKVHGADERERERENRAICRAKERQRKRKREAKRRKREREKDRSVNGVGPAYIVGDRRWWWGREGTHKAEILRAGAGAPRGLRRRNHNAERS